MISRRQFGSLVMGGGVASLVAACGDDDPMPSASAAPAGKTTVQLSWVKDVSFAGTYLAAQRGYFTAEKLDVALRAGGANVVVPTVVAAGTALIGMASTDVTAASRVSGTGLRIIGARFQRNPFCIISTAAKPLTKPADLAGKRVGVSPTNTLAFQSFLAVNDIPAKDVKQVPVQFDVTPLTKGEVDGLLGYYTSQPNLLTAQKVEPATMLLADFGYTLFENVYIVREKDLDQHRDQVVGFLRAERKGWTDNLADPAAGVTVTMDQYGKESGLDEATQKAQNDSQNQLIKPAGNTPLLGMAAADITANLDFLRHSIKINVDDALFDTSVLNAL